MFTLINQAGKLNSFNSRAEANGEDHRPAGDVSFEVNVGGDMLAHFAPTLRWSLYHKGDPAEQDLADQSHEAPKLRYPQMGTLPWDSEYIGYTLTIARGIGGKSDLKIEDVAVNKFRFSPQEGGTCIIAFRCQFHPSERQAGGLCMLLQQVCEISLTPPEAAEAPQETQP